MNDDNMIVVAPGNTAGIGDLASPDDSSEADKTHGRRKRVTFDLDLQVHTIPNRIPIYERKPATSKSYPLTFVPRPVDFKGKEKYNSKGKIIDLFSPTNGFPTYSLPKKGPRQAKKVTAELANSMPPLPREPYSFSTARQQIKLSRAAASLRDITAELRDQFEQSYQPFLRDRQPTRGTSASSVSSTRSAGSVTHGANKQQPVFNAVAQFSKTRPRSNNGKRQNNLLQEKGSAESPTLLRQRSGMPALGSPSSPGQALGRVTAGTESPRNAQPLPPKRIPQNSVTRKDYKPRVTIDMNTVAVHFNDPASKRKPNSQGKSDKPSSAKSDTTHERPLSRCSTIETYVITDLDLQHKNGATARQRSVAGSPSRRPIAWGGSPEAEDENTIVVDINNAQNLNNFKEVPYRLPQWRVSARPAKLST